MTGVDGQTGSTIFNKRYCVSNSSGPAKKNDSVNRCWDLAQASLDANGKPQFNTARTGGLTCPCQFIDWDHDANGGHVPGYNTAPPAPNPLNCADHSPTCGLTYINGASGHPMYRGPAPIVASAASFGDGSATAKGWWTDNTYNGSSHTIGTLELAAAATAGQYQFSSQPNSVLGGFFPLDPAGQYPLYTAAPAGPGAVRMVGTEASLCNLWPYWFSAYELRRWGRLQVGPVPVPPEPDDVDDVGHQCGARVHPTARRQTSTPRSTRTARTGPGTLARQGWYHDSWFSDEARYLFTFNGAVQPELLRRRRHVHLHQRRPRHRPRRRSPAAPGPGSGRRQRHGDHHRGRLAQRGGDGDSPLRDDDDGSVHHGAVQQPDGHRRQRSQQLHEHHLRLPHPNRQPRPHRRQHLRDRHLRRRPSPDRVELPADAERVLDQPDRSAAPPAATAYRPAARSATAATRGSRRRPPPATA